MNAQGRLTLADTLKYLDSGQFAPLLRQAGRLKDGQNGLRRLDDHGSLVCLAQVVAGFCSRDDLTWLSSLRQFQLRELRRRLGGNAAAAQLAQANKLAQSISRACPELLVILANRVLKPSPGPRSISNLALHYNDLLTSWALLGNMARLTLWERRERLPAVLHERRDLLWEYLEPLVTSEPSG